MSFYYYKTIGIHGADIIVPEIVEISMIQFPLAGAEVTLSCRYKETSGHKIYLDGVEIAVTSETVVGSYLDIVVTLPAKAAGTYSLGVADSDAVINTREDAVQYIDSSAPNTPDDPTISNETTSGYRVNWGFIIGATSVKIKINGVEQAGEYTGSYTTITGRTSGVTDKISIAGRNSSGTGTYSGEVDATPLALSTNNVNTIGTHALASVVALSGEVTLMDSAAGDLYVPRMESEVITERQFGFYFRDVMDNSAGTMEPVS